LTVKTRAILAAPASSAHLDLKLSS
jgi:hypothetical protein